MPWELPNILPSDLDVTLSPHRCSLSTCQVADLLDPPFPSFLWN